MRRPLPVCVTEFLFTACRVAHTDAFFDVHDIALIRCIEKGSLSYIDVLSEGNAPAYLPVHTVEY